MESLIRAIISAAFVGFVVFAVIMFIFALTAPSEFFLRRIGRERQVPPTATTTVIERERVIEVQPDTQGILEQVRRLIGGREEAPTPPPPPSPPPPSPPTNFTIVDMVAESNSFSPSRITTVLGNTVRINFKAIDKTYNIVIPAYGLQQQARIGETKVVEFQAIQAGEFIYECTICSPRVRGTLVVSE